MRKITPWMTFGALVSMFLGVLYAAAPKAAVSLEEARAIAMKTVPGTVKSGELEHEKGRHVYSFDIVGRDKAIHEILVNANTGKIVSNKIESAAKETKEANEDKK